MKTLLLIAALICIVAGVKHLIKRAIRMLDVSDAEPMNSDDQYTYDRMNPNEYDG